MCNIPFHKHFMTSSQMVSPSKGGVITLTCQILFCSFQLSIIFPNKTHALTRITSELWINDFMIFKKKNIHIGRIAISCYLSSHSNATNNGRRCHMCLSMSRDVLSVITNVTWRNWMSMMMWHGVIGSQLWRGTM